MPHALTTEQCNQRVARACNVLEMIKNEPGFLDLIITGDESWCFVYDPETKCRIASWCGENSPRVAKTSFPKIENQDNGRFFFDGKGIVNQEFVPAAEMVNAQFHLEVLDRLCKRITGLRPEMWKNQMFFLLRDYALAHMATIVQLFLAKKGVTVLSHPSTLLVGDPDYFAFPKLKLELKGNYYATVEEVQSTVTH